MSENIIDTLSKSEKIDNPALIQKRESMRANTEVYTIQSGDTIAAIARKFGIGNYDDLLALNRLLGKNLEAQ